MEIKIEDTKIQLKIDIFDLLDSLSDEEWHEKAFAQMSSDASLTHMKQFHEAGLQLLGLEV